MYAFLLIFSGISYFLPITSFNIVLLYLISLGKGIFEVLRLNIQGTQWNIEYPEYFHRCTFPKTFVIIYTTVPELIKGTLAFKKEREKLLLS